MSELTLDDFIKLAFERIVGVLYKYPMPDEKKKDLELLRATTAAQRYQYLKLMVAPLGSARYIEYRQEEAGVTLETDDYELIKKLVDKLIEVV